jgi:CubicO group peptidase (beta-lactamase class C family)
MRSFLSALAVTLLLAAPAGAGATLPDSPLGRHARAYFEAYAAGDSASVARYAQEHVAPDSRARTPMAERVRRFREMKADHGALTIVDVPNDDDAELSVRVRDAHGESMSLTFMAAPGPEHLLMGMRVEMGGGRPGDPGSAPVNADRSPLTEAQAAQAIRDELARRPDFSGVVLLAKGDRSLVSEARGLADRAKKTPITLGSRFNFASIGKIFTKLAIAQLAEAGKIALSDRLQRWVPQYKVANAEKITLDQLVEHRGGVPDVLSLVHDANAQAKMVDVASWVHLLLDQPLEFEPGAKSQYSNGGYVLLGAVVQHVSGVDFYDHVQRHIFAPAGMTATAWDRKDSPAGTRATGYTRGLEPAPGGGHKPADLSQPRESAQDLWPMRGSPAGGGFTSATDLWKFAEALRAGKLASPAWSAWCVGGPAPAAADASAGPGFEGIGFGIAGGSPGTNGVLEFSGPYDVVVLTNDDPPGAEELTRAIRGILNRVPRT